MGGVCRSRGSTALLFISKIWILSNSTLYSASLSLLMIIFVLTLLDTWNCYYFESDLNLVLLIKVLLTKKHVKLFCSLLNRKKWLCHRSLFLLYHVFPWDDIVKKMSKVRALEKIYKESGWSYRGRGCVQKERVQTFCTLCTMSSYLGWCCHALSWCSYTRKIIWICWY